MVPFLASPRKGPHIQMAHYSSIWLCILHKILFQCLTTSISNTGVTIFHEGSPLQSKQPGSCFGSIFWRGSIARASESTSTYQYSSPVSVCEERAPRLSALRCDSWLNSSQSLPRRQLCFFDAHLCVIKVMPRKYLSGWLIETEGRGIDQEATAKTSQHSQPGARPNTPARNLDLHDTPRTPLFHLNLEAPTEGWLSAYLSVLCVLFLFVH